MRERYERGELTTTVDIPYDHGAIKDQKKRRKVSDISPAASQPARFRKVNQPSKMAVRSQLGFMSRSRSPQTIFVDEFTEAGLFQQMKGAQGHKAIVGKEEASQFIDGILSGAREKSKIDVERLIQLYDGATWVTQRAIKVQDRYISLIINVTDRL
ncbi:hypothetical protein OS493_003124 [Desmophyllum pertusum]|uniref:Uncharacterized protein n=1 Tax=Desmophyllum pertusum TaxID=174260 RepID=A0A9W9YGR6_9CNID|nr:hypothetical protein OS493_003124 [Desmophyllum pertusum]